MSKASTKTQITVSCSCRIHSNDDGSTDGRTVEHCSERLCLVPTKGRVSVHSNLSLKFLSSCFCISHQCEDVFGSHWILMSRSESHVVLAFVDVIFFALLA